jgi:hypothetical protein
MSVLCLIIGFLLLLYPFNTEVLDRKYSEEELAIIT